MTRIIAFRLEADSAVALRSAAQLRGQGVSQFIREAIHREIKSPSTEREGASDFAGPSQGGLKA